MEQINTGFQTDWSFCLSSAKRSQGKRATYERQTTQGVAVRRGRCDALDNRLPGVAPGLYLLVLRTADGTRQVPRVAVP
jgi:hypothetical protein